MKVFLSLLAFFLCHYAGIAQNEIPEGHIRINIIVQNSTEHLIELTENVVSENLDYYNHYDIPPDSVVHIRTTHTSDISSAKYLLETFEVNGTIAPNINDNRNWSLVKINDKTSELVFVVESFQPEEKLITDEAVEADSEDYVLIPEVEPEFPGGFEKMLEYVKDSIVYTNEIQKLGDSALPPSHIYIAFIVEKDGSISRPEILKGDEDLSKDLKTFILSRITSMPKWKPAESGGKIVRSRYTIPILIHWG